MRKRRPHSKYRYPDHEIVHDDNIRDIYRLFSIHAKMKHKRARFP